MSENKIYSVKQEIADSSHNNAENYLRMYQYSIDSPDAFWSDQANNFVDWMKPWNSVMDYDYLTGHIRWFEGATLNVSVNCIDRHLESRGDQVAIIWEGDDPSCVFRRRCKTNVVLSNVNSVIVSSASQTTNSRVTTMRVGNSCSSNKAVR